MAGELGPWIFNQDLCVEFSTWSHAVQDPMKSALKAPVSVGRQDCRGIHHASALHVTAYALGPS